MRRRGHQQRPQAILLFGERQYHAIILAKPNGEFTIRNLQPGEKL
jgi:hypothetical protein